MCSSDLKKIMLSILVVGTTLFASNNAPIYKTGLLLAPKGDVIYKKQCSSCHGDNGKQTSYEGSSRIKYGEIAGVDTNALIKDLKDYRGGIKSKNYQTHNKYGYGSLMRSVTVDLSWAEIDAVAKYVNNLK